MLEYLHLDSPEKSGSNETNGFWKPSIQDDAPTQMPTQPPF